METSKTMTDISALDDDRIECPCQNYASMSKILEALESPEEQMQGLLDWLNGTTDAIALASEQRLSCGKRSRCRFRFGTSFAILNAIRDACRPYLEPGSLGTLTISNNVNESSPSSSRASQQPPQPPPAVSYDEAFPTFGGTKKQEAESENAFFRPSIATITTPHPAAANILVPRKKSTAAPHPAAANVFVVPKESPSSSSNAFTSASHSETTNILVPRKKQPPPSPNDHPAAANILIPRKKSNSKKHTAEIHNAPPVKKPKRRIRPQPANPAVSTNSVWGEQSVSSSVSTLGSYHGNIASLPSEEPLTLLSRKASATLLNIPKVVVLDTTTTTTTSITGSPSPSTTSTPTKTTHHVEDTTTTTSSVIMQAQSKPSFSSSSKEEHLTRMVDIYIALITNHLIPSTALELHLLLRLLTVSLLVEKKQTTTTLALSPITEHPSDDNTPAFFAAIFSSPQRCRSFAVLGLSRLVFILRNLGLPLVQGLVHCEPFCTLLPEIAKELESVVTEHITRGLRTEYPTDAVTGTHAILSLPFEHDRDSRHNYRTQQQVQIYKNREESRDAFLYQLRAFMNVKGKVLRPQEADRALERIQVESRHVMLGLLPVNMVWFAQFFCELLLQIGLAPMEETDEELLNIADKDKLQVRTKKLIMTWHAHGMQGPFTRCCTPLTCS
jgi:hypothetical protein